MASSYSRWTAALAVALSLGCGGGSDGGPSEPPVIVLSSAAVAVTEGTPETLTVVLDAAPSANVSVSLSSGARVVVAPTTLDFTPANFDIPKNIVVTPLQDGDLAAGSDTVTATAAGLVTVKLPVAIADDDSQAIVFDTTGLAMAEASIDTFTVRLAYQPAGDVTLNIAPVGTAVAAAPPSLLFTPANYSIPQNVIVAAGQDDDLADGADAVAVGLAGGPSAQMPITIIDDDTQAIVLDADSLTIPEGDTASFTVRLAFQPAANVTVDFGPLDTNVAVSQSAALFTTANWSIPVRVTATAHHDDDIGDEATSVAAGIAGGPGAIVSVTVTDDDVQAILISVDTVFVTEGSFTDVLITLAHQPSGAATVTAGIEGGSGVADVSSSNLMFSTSSWATGLTLSVSGTEDANAVTDIAFLRLASNDGSPPDRLIVVIVADND